MQCMLPLKFSVKKWLEFLRENTGCFSAVDFDNDATALNSDAPLSFCLRVKSNSNRVLCFCASWIIAEICSKKACSIFSWKCCACFDSRFLQQCLPHQIPMLCQTQISMETPACAALLELDCFARSKLADFPLWTAAFEREGSWELSIKPPEAGAWDEFLCWWFHKAILARSFLSCNGQIWQLHLHSEFFLSLLLVRICIANSPVSFFFALLAQMKSWKGLWNHWASKLRAKANLCARASTDDSHWKITALFLQSSRITASCKVW